MFFCVFPRFSVFFPCFFGSHSLSGPFVDLTVRGLERNDQTLMSRPHFFGGSRCLATAKPNAAVNQMIDYATRVEQYVSPRQPDVCTVRRTVQAQNMEGVTEKKHFSVQSRFGAKRYSYKNGAFSHQKKKNPSFAPQIAVYTGGP